MALAGEPHIGHAVGVLLDHGPPFGRAEVRVSRAGGEPDLYQVAFIKPDLWRAEGAGQVWVCDGDVAAIRVGAKPAETRPAGEGRRPRPMHPVFPLDAPIWGRGGDDWRLTADVRAEASLLHVTLEHAQSPEFSASIVIDAENGILQAMRFPGYEVELFGFRREPPDSEVFRVTG